MKLLNIVLIIAVLLLIKSNIYSQKIYPRAKENSTSKVAKNIIKKLKKIDSEKTQTIIVMPVYDKNNKETEESNYLAEKIVHKLNSQLQNSDLSFTVRFFKEDPRLKEIMDNATVPKGNESKYYEELFKKYEVNYFVSANFNLDTYNDNFIIENITLYSNYMIAGSNRKQISINNVSVLNDPGPAPIYRSAFVPGWGQIYKEQKTKGYVLLASEVLFVAGAFVSQNLYNYNIDEAIKNQKNTNTYLFYLEEADKWYAIRNTAFIGAGAIYVYSLIDAIASKRKPKYTAFLHNKRYQISPAYYENTYCLGLNINLNK